MQIKFVLNRKSKTVQPTMHYLSYAKALSDFTVYTAISKIKSVDLPTANGIAFRKWKLMRTRTLQLMDENTSMTNGKMRQMILFQTCEMTRTYFWKKWQQSSVIFTNYKDVFCNHFQYLQLYKNWDYLHKNWDTNFNSFQVNFDKSLYILLKCDQSFVFVQQIIMFQLNQPYFKSKSLIHQQ